MKKKTEFKRIDPNQSIYQAWAGENLASEERRQTPALEYFSNQWTFSEVDQRINEYARAFKSLRNNPESSVTFCTPTLPATMMAFYALNKLGVRAQFVSPEILASSLQNKLDETDTETLVVFDGFYKQITKSIATSTKLKNVIIDSLSNNVEDVPPDTTDKLKQYLDASFSSKNLKKIKTLTGLMQIYKHDKKDVLGVNEFLGMMNRSGEGVEPVFVPNTTSVILYTGGSTGIPKGVEKTDESIISISNYDPRNSREYNGEKRNGVFIPPNHPTAFVHSLTGPWFRGRTQVLQPIYNKHTFPRDVYDLRLNEAIAAPSHFVMFIESDLPDDSLPFLHFPICGGEKVPAPWVPGINAAFDRLGAKTSLYICYGMSELGPCAIMNTGDRSMGNKAGEPLEGVLTRIVDDDGNILDFGQEGNLEVNVDATGSAMKGYFKDPGSTKKIWTIDRYIKTGDRAVKDKHGVHDILGRASEYFIDETGEKHHLYRLEEALYKSHAILEGEATKLTVNGGEIPVAHVVLKNQYQGNEIRALREITEICKGLRPVERPQGVRFIKDFGTNKVSTKREHESLKRVHKGYYCISKSGRVCEITFSKKHSPIARTLNRDKKIKVFDK
jgi:acyl-coenzyme A synthetase/AMP-(fatty) acid ligase